MLTPHDYSAHDATGLADLVRRREVSAAELVDSAAARIQALDPAINAVVARDFDAARAEATRLDASRDQHDAPFAGVPFLAKDINVDVMGFRTTHACRLFADVEPAQQDSRLVRRWKAAGLIILGRTNTPEFATQYVCEPELFGPTLNPWDTTRTPGGSSGGAAAAVVAGMVPMAHASDSGGSIRVPAACCGVFGFKPSSGVVASGSALGPLVGGLNVDHVVTWSVRDCAAMLAATAGPEDFAPTPYAGLGRDRPEDTETAGRPLRIGVVAPCPAGNMPSIQTLARLDETRAMLERMGHSTVDWAWPADVDAMNCALTFWAAEMAVVIDARAAQLGRQPSSGELGAVVEWALDVVRRQSAVDMARARQRMTGIQLRMAAAMADLDMLLLPVTAEPPLPSGLLSDLASRNIDAWAARAGLFAPYTEVFNVTGQPAMSVPLYQDAQGLPLAMQLVGRVGADHQLLYLARALEREMPWAGRRPRL